MSIPIWKFISYPHIIIYTTIYSGNLLNIIPIATFV